MHRRTLALLTAITTLACGPHLAKAPTETPTTMATPSGYLRVDLHQSSGTVAFTRVSVIESASVLHGPAGGDLALVAWKGGQVQRAAPFKFPTTAIVEGGFGPGQGHVSSTLDLASGSSTTLIIPVGDFDRLSVLDAGGNEIAADADLPKVDLGTATSSGGLATRAAGLAPTTSGTAEWPPAPGLIFLDAADKALIPAEILAQTSTVVSFDDLPADQQTAIVSGLAMLTATTAHAIHYLGVAHLNTPAGWPAGLKCAGLTWGDTIVLNVDTPSGLTVTMVHEAAHVRTFELDNAAGGAALSAKWPDAVRAAVSQTVRANALGSGLSDAWTRLQAGGVASHIAGNFTGDPGWQAITDAQAQTLGFESAYGSQNAMEDIAVYTEHLQDPADDGQASFCAALQAQAGRSALAMPLVMPYVKTRLLDALSLIDHDKAENCTGTKLPVEGPRGVYLNGKDMPALVLSDGMKGGWTTDSGNDFLTILASGPNGYTISVQVPAPGKKAPLGLHRLDDVGLFDFHDDAAAVFLANTNQDRSRTSADGLALVSEVSSAKIAITIFNLELRNEIGVVTDTFPISTFTYTP
jgi:hypothetical protein